MSATAGAFRAALACFVVAGATGVLLRFQLAYGVDPGLPLDHVRHAHSHLMYLGWGTPAAMALIGARLPHHGARPLCRRTRLLLGAILACAFATWPLFLLFGYGAVPGLDVRMPPAAAASGINVLLWYAWAALYVRATRGVRRTLALRLWDLAVAFLLLSTVGAWGAGLLAPFGVNDPRMTNAMVHLFLDLFSQGWFVLAVLGLCWDAASPDTPGRHWTVLPMAFGTPLTFALALPATDLPAGVRVLAGVAGAAVAVALLAHAWSLRSRLRAPWRVPVGLLVLSAAGLLVAGVTPAIDWPRLGGMRVLYLHVLLLGFLTLGLFAAAEGVLGPRRAPGRLPMTAAVLVLLASLVPLSALWPEALAGTWTARLAAWVAPAAPLGAMWALSQSVTGQKSSPGGRDGTDRTEERRDQRAVRGRP